MAGMNLLAGCMPPSSAQRITNIASSEGKHNGAQNRRSRSLLLVSLESTVCFNSQLKCQLTSSFPCVEGREYSRLMNSYLL